MGAVSVLFNEPKLLKCFGLAAAKFVVTGFSALQRAEIAEIEHLTLTPCIRYRFSALQRAEIAEIGCPHRFRDARESVSVLFNEPKLLKSTMSKTTFAELLGFSALQRAEIAEISTHRRADDVCSQFQCSSTSRNC